MKHNNHIGDDVMEHIETLIGADEMAEIRQTVALEYQAEAIADEAEKKGIFKPQERNTIEKFMNFLLAEGWSAPTPAV